MIRPIRRNDINNSTSRIWTKAELKITTDQATKAGLEVYINPDTTGIVNPENNDLVLKALAGPNDTMLVRFDQSYFEA